MTRPSSTGPFIHFEDVCLRLGGNCILSGVNFMVEPGSIHCIIGPNGGGKSSLVRCLLGQMPHTGTIRIGWGAGQTIGYVPQSLDFDRTLPMTVEDFMAMICQNRPAFAGLGRRWRPVVQQALARVDMLGRSKRPFGALSGGERQRVLLAQGLIPRPDLLVLDEPGTGLDKAGAAIMRELLVELKEQGVTMLMIHHDLAEVRDMADAVTCINRNLLFSGSPELELTPEKILNVFSPAGGAC
jgi:zinc transport system ATP-binding protein